MYAHAISEFFALIWLHTERQTHSDCLKDWIVGCNKRSALHRVILYSHKPVIAAPEPQSYRATVRRNARWLLRSTVADVLCAAISALKIPKNVLIYFV